jgi:metal-responsive CopG/Arc/MetJ family transcriptional regulator
MNRPDAERILMVMPRSLVEAIDDYRFGNRVPSRSEAIRRLLAAALEAERQRTAPKPRRGAKPTAA